MKEFLVCYRYDNSLRVMAASPLEAAKQVEQKMRNEYGVTSELEFWYDVHLVHTYPDGTKEFPFLEGSRSSQLVDGYVKEKSWA